VSGAPAIQVEDLHKSFSIPTHKVDSLKERMVRPFATRDYRELHALAGVSFEIEQGEFFGIVGRNGSGKSTLLKLLASIYRADSGTIRMAGRLAPFIELGVGFNPELTARENVVLNGVMMGLTPQETRARLGAILEFAELEEFVDLKLKNYSSGMLVRLGFSLMMEVDADILLIDEVLAVGDAAFQQKCADVFYEMKAAGKTIVLVTHDMGAVEEYCDRAMLIDSGRIVQLGDPADVGRRYVQLNFEQEKAATQEEAPAQAPANEEARLLKTGIESADGTLVTNVESGSQIRLRLEFEVLRQMPGVAVSFVIANADGVGIFGFGSGVVTGPDGESLASGTQVEVTVRVENLLAPGRHVVHCCIYNTGGGIALYTSSAFDFVVYGGTAQPSGVVNLPYETEAAILAGNRR
jgi:ABC-type polysaccharide/polyol phosphate transport system ATPase subunit